MGDCEQPGILYVVAADLPVGIYPDILEFGQGLVEFAICGKGD